MVLLRADGKLFVAIDGQGRKVNVLPEILIS
jgi:hypothetical protein